MAQDTDDRATEIRVDLLLDEAARDAGLWDRARGRMGRWTYEDLGYLLMVAGLGALFLWRSGPENLPPGVMLVILTFSLIANWHSFRLSRRLDALVRLLEKQKGRV